MKKYPIFIYDTSKIKDQLNNNYILKRYLPLFEEKKVTIPYVIETFPSHGISGTFTLSPFEREALKITDSVVTKSISFTMARYALIMYGGPLVQNVSHIRNRMQNLFTKDNEAYNFPHPSNHVHGIQFLFPMTQHHLALDMYGLNILTTDLNYSSKFIITSNSITLQKDLEIYCISRSHDFVNHSIIIIDINNAKHKILLDKHGAIINFVSKQPEVDAIGSHTIWGTNEKIFYPIDTKLISHPEKNLDMLSSFSSISPKYQNLDSATKTYGQLHNLNSKISSDIIKTYINDLQREIHNYKKGKITNDIFNSRYQEWTENFFQDQLKKNQFIYEKYSTLPSIITNAPDLSEQHHYSLIKKNNPQLLENMINDIASNIKLSQYYPTMENYRTYDVYSTQLPFILMLKKYGMLENYYMFRKLLILQDVHGT